MAHEFETIHTLDSRSNIYLQVVQEEFGLSNDQMHHEIVGAHRSLVDALKLNGIAYADLKNALVPLTDKMEAAFLFDWTAFPEGTYGQVVMNMMLPALDRNSSRSVLYGDWLQGRIPFEEIYRDSSRSRDRLPQFAQAVRNGTVAVYYTNNLTRASMDRLKAAFQGHVAYMGSVELRGKSLFKAAISSMLIRAFVQHRNVVIEQHEDGFGPLHNKGHLPWDFKKAGLTVRTVESYLYGMFLGYKIERAPFEDEDDRAMALRALTPAPAPIESCSVHLDAQRLVYLRNNHHSALSHAGLAGLSAGQIADRIMDQVRQSYVYSMARSKEDGTLKFNVVIETLDHARVRCGLKYLPTEHRIDVLTLF